MSFVILLLLIGGGLYLFYMWNSSKKLEEKKVEDSAPYAKDELRIENVGPGGVIHLDNIGSDMEDFDVNVIAKHVYREGGDTWYELEGDRGTEKVWIELEEDDELEIAITLKKLKLSDINIGKSDLERIDDKESGQIIYEGQKYSYEDSGSAEFLRYGEEKNKVRFYYWDFEAEDGKHFIGVERWENKSYEVSYSEAIKTSQIKVYSV